MKSWTAIPLVVIIALISFVTGNRFDSRIFADQPKQSATNTSLAEDLEYKDVEEAYDSLKASFDGKLDSAKLIDGLKKGLVDSDRKSVV